MNCEWIFIFNVIINSLLMSMTMMFFIEVIFFVTRLKNPRFKAICRSIPILKLPFDIWRYNFLSWALLKGINPLTCESGSRNLSLGLGFERGEGLPNMFANILMTTKDGSTFTLADVAALSFNRITLQSLIVVFGLVTLVYLANQIICWRVQQAKLKEICQEAILSTRVVLSPLLKNLKVLVVEEAITPFAFRSQIVMPKCLMDDLNQKEYEAVLAHEWEHIRWKDPFFSFLLRFICALFWWVPLKRWLTQFESEQEIACDCSVDRYSLRREDLATAILKAIQMTQPMGGGVLSHLTKQKKVINRFHLLLNPSSERKSFFLIKAIFVLPFIVMLFYGKLWIF